MTVTVRQIVEEIIESLPEKSEVEVDYIEEAKNGEMDRVDIVKSLQLMEDAGLGVFIKGRRGKKSRFAKGMKRAENVINKEALDLLREAISQLDQGEVMLASFIDCEEKAEGDQAVELEEYRDKPHAAQFFNDNTARAVDALKLLQKEGLGSFVIGRRGKFSRFVNGVTKDELTNRPKGLVPAEDVSIIEKRDPKYDVVNNIILRTFEDGQFDNLHDAMIEVNTDDVVKVKQSITELGYFISE